MIRKIYFISLLFLCLMQTMKSQQITTLLTDFGREFEAIHWHEDGRIFATDYANGRLYKITLAGDVETIVEGFSAIAGGGFDQEGNFYFSGINVGKVYRLNEDNSYEEVGSGFNQPVTFLISQTDANLAYVAEYGDNQISSLNLTTKEKSILALDQGIDGPDGLVYDDQGNILVANFDNHQIHRVSLAGEVSDFATVPESGFMGYISRSDQHFYVCSFSRRKIYSISADGQVEHIAGTGFIGANDGNALEASFTLPNGIAINAGADSLLIADKNRIRILTNFATSSVADLGLNLEQFVLGPNPVHDVLTLRYHHAEAFELSYEVFSVDGRIVLPLQTFKSQPGLNSLSLSCDSLETGSYFIRLYDNEGNQEVCYFTKQ